MNSLPLIAVTLGDVAGIGPEVAVRAALDPGVRLLCRPMLVGDAVVVDRAVRMIGAEARIVEAGCPQEARAAFDRGPESLVVWSSASSEDVRRVAGGQIDPRAGGAARDWLVAATRAALARQVDAVVTAPLHKVALQQAGVEAPGHTEILAAECGVKHVAMMLYVPPGERVGGAFGLGVAHVTLHTSLASVPGLLNSQAIRATLELLADFLDQLGCTAPRIGVCALNPHGGEQGRFGDEEGRIITPAMQSVSRPSATIDGPIPADALMRRAIGGEYDGVAAMYHDQGHIAIKLAAFHSAVNVTLGLPIVRTSPSHGTAFDIAWQGRADARGMIGAVHTAVRLAALHSGADAQNV